MHTRRLGNSPVEVSAIGLGCWGMSHAYGPVDEKESLATIDTENVTAAAIRLSPETIEALDALGEQVAGERHNAKNLQFVDDENGC